MDNPKISVIVPVYNVEQYLHRCIDSILAQTFTDFELLLINDGSTDKSGKICDEYAKKDKRIRVFHKENGGVSSARNVGLDNAKGEWVTFVDSDDWVEINYFSDLMKDNYIADLTYFGCRFCFENDSYTIYIPNEFYSQDKETIEKQLGWLKNNPQKVDYLGFTWNKLFNRNIILKNHIAFTENLTLREDEVFTLMYARNIASLRVKAISLYNYRTSYTGLAHSKKSNQEYVLLATQLLKNIEYYSNKNLLDYEYNAILQFYFTAIVKETFLSKFWIHSAKQFIMAGRCHNNQTQNRCIKLIFSFNNSIYNYTMLMLICIFYKLKNLICFFQY